MKDLTVYIAKTFVDNEEIAIGRASKAFVKARDDADAWKNFTGVDAYVIRYTLGVTTGHREEIYSTEKKED